MHVQNALFGLICIFMILVYPMLRGKVVHLIHLCISCIVFVFYECFILQDLFVK
jgi:hypothetical protein